MTMHQWYSDIPLPYHLGHTCRVGGDIEAWAAGGDLIGGEVDVVESPGAEEGGWGEEVGEEEDEEQAGEEGQGGGKHGGFEQAAIKLDKRCIASSSQVEGEGEEKINQVTGWIRFVSFEKEAMDAT